MSPEEKAIQLVGEMYLVHSTSPSVVTLQFAKDCALVAVNTLIESRKDDPRFDDTLYQESSCYYTPLPMYLSYWKIVKKEIENVTFNEN